MISKVPSESIPLRKTRFPFSEIKLIKAEPKRFAVSISILDFLYSIESTLTGNQPFSYGEFQKVIASEHGVFTYVPEIDQAGEFINVGVKRFSSSFKKEKLRCVLKT